MMVLFLVLPWDFPALGRGLSLRPFRGPTTRKRHPDFPALGRGLSLRLSILPLHLLRNRGFPRLRAGTFIEATASNGFVKFSALISPP